MESLEYAVDFSDGIKLKMIAKESEELEDCEKSKRIVLQYENESYSGIFEGLDGDDTVMLKSLQSNHIIGLPITPLKQYLEEK